MKILHFTGHCINRDLYSNLVRCGTEATVIFKNFFLLPLV